MTIYDLKPKFQSMLRPIVKKLADLNCTPNQITWIALIFSISFGVIIIATDANPFVLLLLPFFLFFRMALNAIDGLLAKEYDMKTNFGAILNELSDIVSDVVIYLPFILVHEINQLILIIFVIVGIIVETAGILSQAIYKNRRYDGPMGKSDRAFLMSIIAIVIGLKLLPIYIVNSILFIGIFLGLLTIYNRIKQN